ncbi:MULTISPECIES: TonB family protein [Cyanophyceae]|uniref:Energy transducer TonB n=1 Tax=Leptolyngbya subtilissima DQ-A4 TaxID=2933933 RepID=A0ABV0K9R1_9CYAN|nr:TonB family protein [Nodosilinea sp. FACHB-141]MBD2114206.1 TonB family protein [Nodosilinea sp. FACHB-141]
MTTRFAPPERSRPLWQKLLAPMLLASLGLHGLLLLLPTGTDDVPVPPPDPEQDSVAITRVPPAGQSDVAAIAGAAVSATTSPFTPQQQPSTASAAPVARANAPVVRSARPQARSRAGTPPSQRRSQTASPTRAQSTQPPPAPANPPAAGAVTPTPPAPSAPSSTQPLFDAELGPQLLAYVSTLNLPQAKVDRAAESIQNRFVFNAAAVTNDAFNANQSTWVSTLRQETGQAELSPEINRSEFSTVYPQRVCLADSPGEINVGAVVNPDGSWRDEPALLRSSGYGILDRKALQEIQRHRFEPAEGIKAYVLTIDTSVDYGDRPCLEPNPVP